MVVSLHRLLVREFSRLSLLDMLEHYHTLFTQLPHDESVKIAAGVDLLAELQQQVKQLAPHHDANNPTYEKKTVEVSFALPRRPLG